MSLPLGFKETTNICVHSFHQEGARGNASPRGGQQCQILQDCGITIQGSFDCVG